MNIDPAWDTFMAEIRSAKDGEAIARKLCEKKWPATHGRLQDISQQDYMAFLAEWRRWANLKNQDGPTKHTAQPMIKLPGGGAGGVGVSSDDMPKGATAAQIRKQEADARRIERELLGPGGPGWRGTEWVNE